MSIRAQVVTTTGSSLRITIGYLDRGPLDVTLDTATVSTQTGTATVPIVVNLSQCLGDPNRLQGGDGCQLVIGIALIENGAMVDSVTVPAVTAVPGQIVNVSPAITISPVGSVTITPDTSTVTVGDSTHLTVAVYDANGKPLTGHAVTVTSTTDTIARIDTSGYVVGVDGGATTIVATAGDRVDTAHVTVTFAGGLALNTPSVGFNSPTPTSGIPPHSYVSVTSLYNVPIGGLTATVTYPIGLQMGWLAAVVSDSTFAAPSVVARLRAFLAKATGTQTQSANVATPATLDVVPTRVLPAGTYTASVMVTGPDGAASPAIPVTYVVANGAQIGLSATAITDTVAVGSTTPVTTEIHVTNSGIATLSGLADSVTYGSGARGFVTTSFAPATTAPDSLAIILNPSTLSVGTYAATVTLSSTLPDVTPQTVAVTLYVGPDPTIAFTQDTLTFTQLADAGSNVSGQQIDPILNAGVGTLGTITQGAISYGPNGTGWLGISEGNGVIAAVSNTNVPPLGTLVATIPYTATNAVNNPANLTVLLETNAEFQQVAVGGDFACGLLYGGGVYCWGDNTYGQMGQGTTGGTYPVGVFVPVPTPPGGGQIVTIGVGWYHACALANSGPVYCWGRNDRGQIGTGVASPAVATPTLVTGGLSFNQISGGALFTCGMSFNAGNGTNVTCWGDNTYGQLGTGTADANPHPTPFVGPGFETMATGATHVCANTLATGGQIYCWGDNSSGQLGIGTAGGSSPGFQIVEALSVAATVVTAGDRTTCVVDVNNNGWCWGDNSSGQLGIGSALVRDSVPAEIPGVQFSSLSAGNRMTCGMSLAGGAYCWGDNSVGALGTLALGGSIGTPTLVSGTAGLALNALSVGGDTLQANAMCYLTPSPPDLVYCAGSDAQGQLGVYPMVPPTGTPILPNGQVPITSGGSRVKKAPPKVRKKTH